VQDAVKPATSRLLVWCSTRSATVLKKLQKWDRWHEGKKTLTSSPCVICDQSQSRSHFCNLCEA